MNIFAERTEREFRQNILASYLRSDDQCRAEGRSWYHDAHDHAVRLAAIAGVTVERMAAILAVLSPRSSWGTNIRNATAIAEARWDDVRGLRRNVAKALALIDGAPISAHVTGPKVAAFLHNIAFPDTSNMVTVDSWAAGVAMGRRLSNAEMSALNITQRARIVAAYQDVASDLGLLPHEVQAVCWCEARNRTGWGKPEHNGKVA